MRKHHQLSNRAVRPLLQRIGLDDREVDVYLALLAMKTGKATQIARAAHQSRSHTYLILRSLTEKGLVSEVEKGKIIHFVTEAPERLLNYLQNREQEIHELEALTKGMMPYFTSMTPRKVGEPRVTVAHGLEGIKQVYRDVLARPFVAFFNPKVDWETFGGNIAIQLFGKGAILRGRELLVDNAATRRYIANVPPHKEYRIRLLPKSVAFDADVIIFENEISMFTFSEEPTIIRIENPLLADAFRAWHTALWGISREVTA
ncbi:hypothetical protein COU80_02675 [Candidatus Peregrinibacteria bacterium CG10_big_fil_rev_8_21_14_0_10_55_24]|nr:MAG: hypothetical protein COU80_02675 [Candidatus Peregrinibacteria bacterium CG10_big_fil_rev_8_21_14_0_10_55_24]